MGSRLCLSDCQKHAKTKGGFCLDKKYINNKIKMQWQCKTGHIWFASFDVIKSGRWCSYCAATRLTVQDYYDFAASKNGKCLETEYKGVSAKIKWKCEKEHVWCAKFKDIKHGTWCPYCSKHIALKIQDCHDFAASKNGRCMETEYINNGEIMTWQCEKNHIWSSTFNNLKSGHWCPKCNDPILTIQECHLFAESKNGKCLEKKYKNCYTKMKWQCSYGHIWKTSFKIIKSGCWCPRCPKLKKQSLIISFLKDIFPFYNINSNFKKFSWLRNKLPLQIDIWIPEIRLAIEYDGEQHFMPVCFNGVSKKIAAKKFKNQKQRDKIKNKLIRKHKEDIANFIRFNYKEHITKEYVINKLKKAGINV